MTNKKTNKLAFTTRTGKILPDKQELEEDCTTEELKNMPVDSCRDAVNGSVAFLYLNISSIFR